jgi:TonB-linked SusC/RagA family outer membrane protein
MSFLAYAKIVRVMKLTTVLLLVFALHVGARGYSQKITLRLNDVSLTKAFAAIHKATGYTFTYFMEDVAPFRTTFQVNNVSLDRALEACLKNVPLTYTIMAESKNISIRLKKAETAPLTTDLPGTASINIKGRILDEKGDPLPGVTIVVKGRDKATLTNGNGEFQLDSIASNAVLEITHVGYTREMVKVNGKTQLEIKLSQFIAALQDIAIPYSTGYQTIAADRATGSFSQPDKDIYDNRIATDAITKLEGITSGLVFNRDATGGYSLQIRGISTINANRAPLIVVDNFPYDGDINNINPSDVASVTILKDAAAASIWGSRAGNGVIVITTKKGTFGQSLRVDLSANYSFSVKPNLTYGRNFLDSKSFIGVEQGLFSQGFYDQDLADVVNNPPESPVVEILNNERNGSISQADANAQIAALGNVDVRNQLKKYFYRGVSNQQYAANISGGSNNATYLMSVGYDHDLPDNQVGDNNYRMTTDALTVFRPFSHLEITGGFDYVQSNNTNNSILNNITTGGSNSKQLYPYAQFADVNGNPLPIVKDYSAPFAQSAAGNGFLNWQYYPLLEKNLADNTTHTDDIRLRAGIKYSLIPGLSVEGIYQYEKGASINRVYYSDSSYYARNLINEYTDPTTTPYTNNIPVGDILQLNNSNYMSSNGRVQLNFDHVFGRQKVAAIAGVEARQVTGGSNNDNTLYGYNSGTDAYQFVDYTSYYSTYPSGNYAAIPNGFDIFHTINRYRSYFSNASYTLAEKYIFSASGRIDQTNLFGENANAQSVPLWSVGGKWNISKESFYHLGGLPVLDMRVTYGYQGNIINSGTAYTTASYFRAVAPFPALYQVLSPGNPNLTWERDGMLNIGVDFGTKNDILSGSLEYFGKRGHDLIGPQSLPSSTGFVYAITNYASMVGHGVDIDMSSKNITGSFQWTTRLLLSLATDKVTNYDVANTNGSIFAVPGRPVEALFAYKWAGLDATGNPQGYDTTGKVSTNYEEIVNETATQQKYIGRTQPDVFGALRNTFSYKGVSLSANITYKFGYYFKRSSINYYSLFYSWLGNVDYANRWKKAGDEAHTNVPSVPTTANLDPNRDGFYNGSEAVVEKGDHIRLQDIILSYDLDGSRLRMLPARHVQVSVYVNNIGILWKANKRGIDPDYQQAGYRPPRTVAFSVRVGI